MLQHNTIAIATGHDAAALSELVNSAYRGEGAKKGWTTEADLLDGQRTDPDALINLMQAKGNTILKYTDESGRILGCVYLQQKDNALYLGMLTVSPEMQAAGIGKQLLQAAEAHAQACGCDRITMTVISVRTELISWYERHGYRVTGEKQPFPTDPAFGIPRQPLEFIVMEKALND